MDIKEFIIKNLDKHPADIVNLAMQRYKLTRPAIHKHMDQLIQSGKVIASGTTRARRYSVADSGVVLLTLPLSPQFHESEIWAAHFENATQALSPGCRDICHYGFSEMLNNVIDHSMASEVRITCNFSSTPVLMEIHDNGVGVFLKIQNALHLATARDAILDLTKGKFTTDPARHSGEGIFFTSRMFDVFRISANELEFMRFDEADWAVNTSTVTRGTRVQLQIAKNTLRTLDSVFDQFTNPDTLSFDTTQVAIRLAEQVGSVCMSRSEAKRVLTGLDKFKNVILDFKDVSTVGQGFVDEVFRVYHNQHPDIIFTPIHMNENIEFMVKRGLPKP